MRQLPEVRWFVLACVRINTGGRPGQLARRPFSPLVPRGERGIEFGGRVPRAALVPRLPWAIISSSLRDFSLVRFDDRATHRFGHGYVGRVVRFGACNRDTLVRR